MDEGLGGLAMGLCGVEWRGSSVNTVHGAGCAPVQFVRTSDLTIRDARVLYSFIRFSIAADYSASSPIGWRYFQGLAPQTFVPSQAYTAIVFLLTARSAKISGTLKLLLLTDITKGHALRRRDKDASIRVRLRKELGGGRSTLTGPVAIREIRVHELAVECCVNCGDHMKSQKANLD